MREHEAPRNLAQTLPNDITVLPDKHHFFHPLQPSDTPTNWIGVTQVWRSINSLSVVDFPCLTSKPGVLRSKDGANSYQPVLAQARRAQSTGELGPLLGFSLRGGPRSRHREL
jgi:hypothetical protein